jgi:hypothetical protein
MPKRIWREPASDFTIYKDFETLKRLAESNPAAAATGESSHKTSTPFSIPHYDQTVCFAWPLELLTGNELDSEGAKIKDQLFVLYRARSLACSCFNNSLCSITLRLDDEAPPQFVQRTGGEGLKLPGSFIQVELEESEESHRSKDRTVWRIKEGAKADSNDAFAGIIKRDLLFTGKTWQFASGRQRADNEAFRGSPPRLFSIAGIVRALSPAIFRPHTERELDIKQDVIKHGLIVISGQTGTAKSTILRSLLESYLWSFNFSAWAKDRYPHILTLEDPIEKPMVPLNVDKREDYLNHASRLGVNFTPRQIGMDVPSLKQGLRDALRQTPAAVIVGETRDREDWVELLKFASTGHLCFTTTHAGSLVETMRTIIEATESTTPDLRSSLVEKIIAVIHLRSYDLPESDAPAGAADDRDAFKSMLLPAVWRNVNGGSNFFVSDGLSAILPRRAEGQQGRTPASCRGRSDFAGALLDLATPEVKKMVYGPVMQIATRSDLEGI